MQWFVAFARASTVKIEFFQDTNGSHLTFYIIFLLKYFFSSTVLKMHTPNNSLSIVYHENNIQSPIRTYPIIALCEHWVIFYMPEWYSTNQIPFCHSGFCSIMCYFLVITCLLSRIPTTLSNPTKKNLRGSKWD